ncbi:hypothetical protein HPB50_004794 [Hyalomma asiaticum]|uniref:Uncharacterized protein n=1 Tax=Hyalomma asiaticum TaxID=266040 RepID=A0ACB7SKX1_HYAAI|nr:hypothetical protein HPB50_004794 [Hyalomma asiaticum]
MRRPSHRKRPWRISGSSFVVGPTQPRDEVARPPASTNCWSPRDSHSGFETCSCGARCDDVDDLFLEDSTTGDEEEEEQEERKTRGGGRGTTVSFRR